MLLAAAVLAVTGITLAALRSGTEYAALDPRSAAPGGSRAVAQLLGEHGVHTRTVTSTAEAVAAAGPDTTVLVSDPDALGPRRQRELGRTVRHGGRTVLVAPGPEATETLTPGVRTTTAGPVRATPPDCPLPAARRAGDAELGGHGYHPPAGPEPDACYPQQGAATLLRLPAGPASDGDTVLLGAPEPLTNERLAAHGNASLTLQLLGTRPHLVWFMPSAAEAAGAEGEERGFLDLLPDGWTWAAVQLAVAAALAALWRARRLGPLVTEQLPVTVRASETTEGRARLYRKADARGHAADALRAAARTRLAARLGVPPAQAHTREVLAPAVTAAAQDPSPLFGPAPADDAALTALADALDALEARVAGTTNRPEPPAPPTAKDSTP
nr:DUF4350 domain-containing protein [Streptomyces sp. HNM0574]